MRNPLRSLPEPLAPPVIGAAEGAAPAQAAQRHALLPKLIEWVRAGYPAGAPRRVYSPLLALNGPLSLTADQALRVIDEIDCCAPSSTDIEVAITKATDRLPTPGQVDEVHRALKNRWT